MMPPAPSQRVLRMLFWETTIRCNLACAHCRRLESNETCDADLSTARAELLLEQLAELGRRQPHMPVLVFSGGEPLCRGDLFHLIGTARGHGIVPALATNGTMITVGDRRADSRQRSRARLGESRRGDRRRARPDAADPGGLRSGDRGHSPSPRWRRAFPDQHHADEAERPTIARRSTIWRNPSGPSPFTSSCWSRSAAARRSPRRTCSRPSGTSRSCGRSGPWRAGGKFRSK